MITDNMVLYIIYRSSILTGRYQSRTGVYPGVFVCGSRGSMYASIYRMGANFQGFQIFVDFVVLNNPQKIGL